MWPRSARELHGAVAHGMQNRYARPGGPRLATATFPKGKYARIAGDLCNVGRAGRQWHDIVIMHHALSMIDHSLVCSITGDRESAGMPSVSIVTNMDDASRPRRAYCCVVQGCIEPLLR